MYRISRKAAEAAEAKIIAEIKAEHAAEKARKEAAGLKTEWVPSNIQTRIWEHFEDGYAEIRVCIYYGDKNQLTHDVKEKFVSFTTRHLRDNPEDDPDYDPDEFSHAPEIRDYPEFKQKVEELAQSIGCPIDNIIYW